MRHATLVLAAVLAAMLWACGSGRDSSTMDEHMGGMGAEEHHHVTHGEMMEHVRELSRRAADIMEVMHERAEVQDAHMGEMMDHMHQMAGDMEAAATALGAMMDTERGQMAPYRDHIEQMQRHMSAMTADFEKVLDSMEHMHEES